MFKATEDCQQKSETDKENYHNRSRCWKNKENRTKKNKGVRERKNHELSCSRIKLQYTMYCGRRDYFRRSGDLKKWYIHLDNRPPLPLCKVAGSITTGVRKKRFPPFSLLDRWKNRHRVNQTIDLTLLVATFHLSYSYWKCNAYVFTHVVKKS